MFPFPPFAHLHPALILHPSGHHHAVVCVHGLCLYVLWLIPSPSLIQSYPPPSPLRVISLFHISMLLLYFVCQFIFFIRNVNFLFQGRPNLVYFSSFSISPTVKANRCCSSQSKHDLTYKIS